MDALDRMFRRLVQIIRNDYPEYLGRPFELGELYQNIIPYRLHRRELALETNQDYEMTLLELLSGARGYVIGDDAMQDALRRELTSPNPDASLFRNFAGEHISLAPEAVRRLDQVGAGAADAARVSVPAAARTSAGATIGASPPRPTPQPPPPPPPNPVRAPAFSPVMPTPPLPPAPTAAPHRSISSNAAGGSCRYCAGALPEGRRITFCPHCGQNLTIQHCPACGTELEIGWKFCTTCGRAVAP
jgi:double zinc ribbon protein